MPISIKGEMDKLDFAEAAGEFVPITQSTYEDEVPDAVRGEIYHAVVNKQDWESQKRYVGGVRSVERKIEGEGRVYKITYATGEKAKYVGDMETQDETTVLLKFDPKTQKFEILT